VVLDLGLPPEETPFGRGGADQRGTEARAGVALVVAPDCGMKYLPRELASPRLRAMVEGARSVSH